MDYSYLSIDDEVTVLRNKLRDVEAQHFALTVDLQTIASLGGNEEVEAQVQAGIQAAEAQHQFLEAHLAALKAFAEQNAGEPEAE